MKYENIARLKTALIGSTITEVEAHGGHGMVLTITTNQGQRVDICTYDDGREHDVDEFYVALNGEEL